MADAAMRFLALAGLPTFSTALRSRGRGQRSDFIAPSLSRRSSTLSTASSSGISSTTASSSEQDQDTELQPWRYHKRTAQDEVERKQAELKARRAREAEELWKEFWH